MIFSTIFYLFLAKKSLNVKPARVFREKVWTGIRGRPELSDTWRQRRARSGRVVTMPWSRLPSGGWMGRVEYTPTRPDTMLPLAYNRYMVAGPDPGRQNWHTKVEKIKKSHVLKCWIFFFCEWAEGFFCNLDVLYGGQGIGKLWLLIKKKKVQL